MPGFALIATLYLAAVNVAGLLVMRFDKRRAASQGRRVPEEDLFALAAIGGSVGVWLGMYLFRHKTLHRSFVVGIPAIFALQAMLVVLACVNGWLPI